ncbi:MAG: winged helix-turn-helix domain-containing protein [Vicinamibacterales bacterium]
MLVIEAADHVAERLRRRLSNDRGVSVTVIPSVMTSSAGQSLPVVVGAGGRSVQLTRREAELLGHLAASRGRIVPRDELLARFWGRDTRCLDVYVRRLRRKLGASGRAIETVFGIGYRFVEGILDLDARTSQ